MMGILAFYYPSDSLSNGSTVRFWMEIVNLGITVSSDADWYGNFAGDLAWTIEPIVIICAPMLLKWLIDMHLNAQKQFRNDQISTTQTTEQDDKDNNYTDAKGTDGRSSRDSSTPSRRRSRSRSSKRKED